LFFHLEKEKYSLLGQVVFRVNYAKVSKNVGKALSDGTVVHWKMNFSLSLS